MAQPRSQRDQARAAAANTATTTPSLGTHENNMMDHSSAMSPNMAFPQQPNQMSMLFQRQMNQMPMIGGNMGMMGMNPMALAMGMGMGGFNPMAGMNGMNMVNMGGMNGMSGMNPMGAMGNMGALRLGMGPMGMAGMGSMGMGGTGMGGMNPMGLGMRPNMVGVTNNGFNRVGMNTTATGPGPARATSRGQHNFHPYSR